MDETYCAFCGVCFGIDTELYHGRVDDLDTTWTEYFVALRRRQNHPSHDRDSLESWYLSGVGRDIGWDGHAPPSGHDVRVDGGGLDGDFVVAYTNRNQDYEIVYPIHPACWNIFLQNHALLAKENASKPDLNTLGQLLASQRLEKGHKRGLRPDWTNDYMGPEEFWADGWLYHEEPEASEVAGVLDYSSEWDFLVHDPTDLPNVDELLNNPPLISSEQPSCISPLGASAGDGFPHLPVEIILHILSFLPTASVQALRLASRTFGSVKLNTTYWQTRFDYPNELCHIRLPSTFLCKQREDVHIDWRNLCEKLFRPEPNHLGWQNRKRILSLTGRLVKRLLSISSNTYVDDRAQNEVTINHNYRQSISIPNQTVFTQASVIFGDSSPVGDIQSIRVHFRPTDSASLVIGLEFRGINDTARLGSCFSDSTHQTDVGKGTNLKRLIAAVIPLGVVGLEFSFQSQSAQNHGSKFTTFGDFKGSEALGQLDLGDEFINGIFCEFAADGRLISIKLLESQPTFDSSQGLKCASILSSYLWHPALPPSGLNMTAATGIKNGKEFSYMHPTIFAMDSEALCHMTRVSTFLGLEPLGVHGFQFHFDDRDSIPAQADFQGKEATFLIDGPGGERIFALDILWSEQTDTAGVEFVTNHNRRSCFTTADVFSGIQIARQAIPVDSCIAGVFGEISNDKKSAYRKFGLFWSSGPHSTPPAPKILPVDNRRFDDHFNIWTDSSRPPSDYLLGEAIGSHPDHGFINWISFERRIKRLVVCLGAHTRNFRNDPVELNIVGIIFDVRGSGPTLLGRCTSLGPSFELGDDDFLTGVTIGTHETQRSRILKEILFHTRQNLCIGFKGDKIATSYSVDCEKRFLKSTQDLCLVGLIWSFDLGPGSTGDHGIQPLYRRLNRDQSLDNSQHELYPSLIWARPPPPGLQLRPIPEMRSNRFDFTSSLAPEDDIDQMADYSLTAIRVYFNAFLQGIVFEFRNGQVRAVGNKVGMHRVFRLEDERITAVWFHERVQKLFAMSLPREIICVDGIRFGVVKWVDGKPQEPRFSPFFGCAQPFGPFINNQRGLWNPYGGGSSNWGSCFKEQTTKILLAPGTSFAGLFAESANTYIRRAGVLISNVCPLPDDISGPKDPSFQPEPINNIEVAISEPPPWLGPSPCARLGISSVAGQPKGKYRLWCEVLPGVSKATIYRHKTSEHKIVTIGLEFYHDLGSDLLGFRSLWTEHSREVEFEEGEKVVGFRFERDDHLIQGNIDIITSREQISSRSSNDETSQVVVVDECATLVGAYAILDVRTKSLPPGRNTIAVER